MAVDLRNGLVTSYQSGSSIRLPSQRFPKVSIGIMVEKTPKMGFLARKEDETLLPAKGLVPSSQEKIVKVDGGLGSTTVFAENVTLGKEKLSPWFSTRSMHHETPTAQTVLHVKASLLQSDDGLPEKLDGAIYEKRREKSGNVYGVEEIAFAATQEMHLLHKENAEEPPKCREDRSEALRMKLWEALGVASSQGKHISNPPLAKENAKLSKTENHEDCQIHEVPKHRQDTDTIETDSENLNMSPRKCSPNQTMRRPFTRSFARKKDLGKTLPKLQLEKSNARKNLSSSRLEIKQKSKEKNIFAFDEGEKQMESSMFAANGHLPVSDQKKNGIKSARVEPRRISFPSRSVSRKSLQSSKNLQSSDEEQPKPSPENEANRRSAVQDTRTIHCEVENNRQPSNSLSGKFVSSKKIHLENLSNSSLSSSSDTRELDSPPPEMVFKGSQSRPLSKDGKRHEKLSGPTLTRKPSSIDHLYSPTFAVNMTTSPLERRSTEDRFPSPMLSEEKAPAKSSKSPLNPRASSSESVVHPEPSDGTRDPQASPTGESTPVGKGKTSEKCLSPSQVQPLSSESLEMDEHVDRGFRKTQRWYSKASAHNKSPFTLRHGKRIRTLEDVEVRKFEPSSVFPFNFSGNGETIVSDGLLDNTPENGLARAITQLTVVMERFKAKIKLHTCKKSSEILSSVGDSIHLRLQEIESLIQADAEKFTSLGKSKRKRLESTFLEQQEKLKAIHEKFKEEVNQHLVDCRGTLEELEAYQEELKGNVERQKAAHRKLVLQVKEAAETRLADAETSIATVHKVARKKMNGLKHAMREWLADDGMLN
uniref:Meiosis-specific protein ASY3-like coiled-coil domain-containing protein n=1 Tax=Anthurium amnicola TaxID=1678845 RepID=A0A1D1XWQ6_9ARAE